MFKLIEIIKVFGILHVSTDNLSLGYGFTYFNSIFTFSI